LDAEDRSVSASRFAPDKRPGWQQILAAADRLDIVVVWKIDRLARRTIDFLNVHQQLQQHGCEIAAVADNIDMSSPTGRGFATILAVFGEIEAASIGVRQAAARDHALRSGRAAGMPPWHLRTVPADTGGKRYEVIPERAAALNDAADRIIGGTVGLRQLCREFDRDPALKPTRTDRWQASTMRKLLRSPTLYGAIPNAGALLRGEDGLILAPPERAAMPYTRWQQMQDAMNGWTTAYQQRGDERPILANVLHCHACSEPLYVNRSGKVPRYVCVNTDCPHPVAISQNAVEQHLETYFLHTFGDYPDWVPDTGTDSADAEQIKATITNLSARIAAATDKDELLSLFDERETLQNELQRLPSTSRLIPLRGTHRPVKDAWAACRDDAERNALMRQYLHVTVHPGQRGKRFDPDRLTVRDLHAEAEELQTRWDAGERF